MAWRSRFTARNRNPQTSEAISLPTQVFNPNYDRASDQWTLGMKFEEISIENFRGITQIRLAELPTTVVVAGPNGCGKSSIFDAMRLWKSAYGGYQGEEIQWWLQEFGLQAGQNPFSRVLQSPTRPLIIRGAISLTQDERSWLRTNAPGLIRESVYRRLIPNYNQMHPFPGAGMAIGRTNRMVESLRGQEPAVQTAIERELPAFLHELEQETLTGTLTCQPDGQAIKTPSVALEQVFNLYDGKNVGIIDYHGPHRTFVREEVGGINLQIDQYQNQRQQSALYNSANKYSGVKGELASAYIRDLIAESAGSPVDSLGLRLADTLQELFTNFFPGKTFAGVQPVGDGSLKFEVHTPAGNHDINDLSSGEKELLYGYLRLRNDAPRNSIILLDEPELHLNPRLTDGLTEFYHRHIGLALNNQLWLVTHSDTILRQAVGREGHKVFHMLTAGSPLAQPEQALEIKADADVERAVIDLVGDLAAYKPGAKIVFLEGGGNSPFDETLIEELFPEFSASVNLISGGNKARVQQVTSLLERAQEAGAMVGKTFAITDQDNDVLNESAPANCHQWDRYHIENYLLEPDFVARTVIDLNRGREIDVRTDALVGLLRGCAEDTLPGLIRHELEDGTSKMLVRAISANTSREGEFEVGALRRALEESQERINELLEGPLSQEKLEERATEVRAKLVSDLEEGRWIATFRGRDILGRFVAKHMGGVVRYEVFRDLIVARMRDGKFKPEGMSKILLKIEQA
jgi:energy-coupling factor transporter ATP-binding protein EcfA2